MEKKTEKLIKKTSIEIDMKYIIYTWKLTQEAAKPVSTGTNVPES